ncbi:hypothetical protein RFI_33617, partial [Reticulomyxa filosa]
MNDHLVEAYWDMMKTLVRVETLKHIDLLLPDPHLLLLGDIIKQGGTMFSENETENAEMKSETNGKNAHNVEKINNGTHLKYKTSQIPVHSFYVCSTQLKFLKFAVKSLSGEQLLNMLDHLFMYYYYNYDNLDLLSEFAHLSNRNVGKNAKSE